MDSWIVFSAAVGVMGLLGTVWAWVDDLLDRRATVGKRR